MTATGNAVRALVHRSLVEMTGSHWLLYASDFSHDRGAGDGWLVAALDDPSHAAVLAGDPAAVDRL
jgi:hypothetical protein